MGMRPNKARIQAMAEFTNAWSAIAPKNVHPQQFALTGTDANNLLYDIAQKVVSKKIEPGERLQGILTELQKKLEELKIRQGAAEEQVRRIHLKLPEANPIEKEGLSGLLQSNRLNLKAIEPLLVKRSEEIKAVEARIIAGRFPARSQNPLKSSFLKECMAGRRTNCPDRKFKLIRLRGTYSSPHGSQ